MKIEKNTIYNMDCLEGMKYIPDGSIDAIICDLPYGTMKGSGLDGWDHTDTDWDEIIPTDRLFEQYERVLRMNGVAILFSQEPYTSHLRSYKYKNSNFSFRYPMIYKKNHFANALIAKRAPVSHFEDMSVFVKSYDTSGTHPLRKYFSAVLSFIGDNLGTINKKLGHRKAEHCFYVSPQNLVRQEIGGKADHTFRGSTQFSLCTCDTYKELIAKFHIDKMQGFLTFEQLQEINAKYQRTFNIPEGKRCVSNVLEYTKERNGFHPTQKPVALIADLVRTYTNEGDTILDNCMGSGTTAVACIKEKRHFIGFELNKEYYDKAMQRIKAEQQKIVIF